MSKSAIALLNLVIVAATLLLCGLDNALGLFVATFLVLSLLFSHFLYRYAHITPSSLLSPATWQK